jgi:threonine dehydrogenase-like Zn-dependent dehydrogenase
LRKGFRVRAITVLPGVPNSARLDEIAGPPVADGPVLVRTLALGVCGTDREIVSGAYGEAPAGRSRLVLGHESLGEVMQAPPASGLAAGDRIVGIVRRPDPVPCPACAAGEWDMCRNGRYSERGIKGRDGYGAEQFRIEPEFAIKVDAALGPPAVLLEPTSVVAKAWDHIDRIGRRTRSWQPRRLLVTGAGPIGLLAALIGVQRGLDVHLLDRNAGGAKPALASDLGAAFHAGTVSELGGLEPDVVIECTGAPPIVAELLARPTRNSILCLLGIGGPRSLEFDVGKFNAASVLDNRVVFGSVNANRAHYDAATGALKRADPKWLSRLISRRVPLARWPEALQRQPDDIKVVIDFTL